MFSSLAPSLCLIGSGRIRTGLPKEGDVNVTVFVCTCVVKVGPYRADCLAYNLVGEYAIVSQCARATAP